MNIYIYIYIYILIQLKICCKKTNKFHRATFENHWDLLLRDCAKGREKKHKYTTHITL